MLKVNLPSFKIDEKEILKKISFELKEDENLTILGSNGAGKSTLAKLLCGLLKSKKSIMIEDTFIESLASYRRSKLINYIPAKLSIYDTYINVYDFLALSFHTLKIEEVLNLLGLSKFEKSYCSDLSSGEQQLLLLASAMVQDAKITIFDEPTSNLDPRKTKLAFEILKNSNYLKQKIIITHDLQLALKLNYPILYMTNGDAKEYKSADEFFTPSNLHDIFGDSVVIDGKKVMVNL
jgi:iron complex transport system ATP-binding protein